MHLRLGRTFGASADLPFQLETIPCQVTLSILKNVMEKTSRQIKVENKEIKLVYDSVTFFPVFLIKVGNRQELG